MAQWIFVTEDDDGIREMIQIALESLSYQVSVFATAEETLAAVIKYQPPETSPSSQGNSSL